MVFHGRRHLYNNRDDSLKGGGFNIGTSTGISISVLYEMYEGNHKWQ